MRAWVVRRPSPIDDGPLAFVERDDPHPGPGEVRVRVSVCGVCRTDLHLAEGDLPPHRRRRRTRARDRRRGRRARRRAPRGSRSGSASGSPGCATPAARAASAVRGDENLCLDPAVHGLGRRRGVRRVRRRRRGASPTALPDGSPTREVAPLLCAGIIGYRALRRAALPEGGRLGHLRVRRLGAPRRPGGHRRGRDGARVDPVGRGQAPRARARRGLGRRHLRRSRPSRSTRPSCFAPGRRARARPRSRRSTAAARWRSPASTSATSRRCATPSTCSRSASSAASRPTPATTARDFLAVAAQIADPGHDEAVPARPGRRAPWPISPTTGSTGAAVLVVADSATLTDRPGAWPPAPRASSQRKAGITSSANSVTASVRVAWSVASRAVAKIRHTSSKSMAAFQRSISATTRSGVPAKARSRLNSL